MVSTGQLDVELEVNADDWMVLLDVRRIDLLPPIAAGVFDLWRLWWRWIGTAALWIAIGWASSWRDSSSC